MQESAGCKAIDAEPLIKLPPLPATVKAPVPLLRTNINQLSANVEANVKVSVPAPPVHT